ncbi:hypothetical protein JEQ12_007514 [Ovis aries]|uniref:Immunoglobulin V-set domain-containing protein n=1 Tax=Ovis aries TaxID=9940 RepID=A0A835ZY07_SHEEP|nr:hypothetical protein JEQ12_007514 [Ovis aries]
MAMMTRDSRQSPAFVTDDRVLASLLPTTLHPVASSSMIKFTLSKVVDMFSDLPERDTHFLVLPLNPSDVSLLQKPQQSDSQEHQPDSQTAPCTVGQCWWLANILFPAEAREHPQDLLVFKSDSNKLQASGVPSHFSGSKAASANEGLLLISGLQTQDEADYDCYCHQNTGIYQGLQAHSGPVPSLTQLSLLLCLDRV